MGATSLVKVTADAGAALVCDWPACASETYCTKSVARPSLPSGPRARPARPSRTGASNTNRMRRYYVALNCNAATSGRPPVQVIVPESHFSCPQLMRLAIVYAPQIDGSGWSRTLPNPEEEAYSCVHGPRSLLS